ncbi:hypothetical protein LX64_00773 [Chitinophaga skermanii]|uniref:Uncharacterized protein n=1 Tax=Chitinophaga skermanii TaxID=331697 RepID=A0A327R4M4_9BACT|nr:hypothetical protein LX64_00773 [Chitinophaga skermanii]
MTALQGVDCNPFVAQNTQILKHYNGFSYTGHAENLFAKE